ncbi:MAG: hypothetical protein WCG95_01170 [bacterium]
MRITKKTTKPVSYFVKVAEAKGLKLKRLMAQNAPSGIIADAFVQFNSILHNSTKGRGSKLEKLRAYYCSKSIVHILATGYLRKYGYSFDRSNSRLIAPSAKCIAMLKANSSLYLRQWY